MKIKFLIFFLLHSIFINSQNKKIEILNTQNKPIPKVGIYIKNKKIGETDVMGKFEIEKQKPEDSIFFIKSGFENLAFQFKNIVTNIKLDSLRTMDIEELIIINYNAKTLLEKIIDAGKNTQLYPAPKNISINKKLNSKDKIFYYLDNNFFWKPKIGHFIENKNNITKNILAYKRREGEIDYIYKICELNDDKFSLFSYKISGYGYVTGRYIPQIKDILTDFDKYNFKTEKSEGKIILSFTPKANTKRVYIGRIIIDSDDFGIYEGIFNLIKNEKNKEITTIEYKNKHSFENRK